jgi:hypothetical protein
MPHSDDARQRRSKCPIAGRRPAGMRLWAAIALVLAAPASAPADAGPGSVAGRAVGHPGSELFSDRAVRAGLTFTHFNGMTGELYLAEMTGAGAAFLDFDNDGDLDLFLLQGTMLGEGKTPRDALFPLPEGEQEIDRLYRNDLAPGPDGGPVLRLVDVTAGSGIKSDGYGMGVAAGDFDNDGWTDLYVTNYGPNGMFRNNGDGTFTDVTDLSGAQDPAWSTSAAVLDYDRDGWLDLFVANYVDAPLGNNPRCYATSSRRDYCGPSTFPPVADRLFRNRGNGTFEDVSASALQQAEPGAGLGVAAADFDGDGWIDLYVANDGMPNHLWSNRGDGSFREDALFNGVALNRFGSAEASMGVDAGDFDGDGDEDLFMGHLMSESSTLFVNDGGGIFEDRTSEVGLGADTLPFTSFGTAWVDYDNDSWLDLLVLNGAVRIIEHLALAGDPFPLGQTNRLYRSLSGRGFEDVSGHAGAAFQLLEVSRGAAVGDVDNDGDTDLLIANNNGPARLMVNNVGSHRPWLGLRLVGGTASRDMLGARAAAIFPDGRRIWRRVRTDGSYCSGNDPRVLFGLGEAEKVSAVRVQWPDGTVEEWEGPPTGRYTTLHQGSGTRRD